MKQKINSDRTKITNISLVVSSCLCVFVGATILAAGRPISETEKGIFYIIYELPEWLWPMFLIITQAGSTWALMAMVFWAWATHRKRLAFFGLLAGAITYILTYAGKLLIARPRPEFILNDLAAREPLTNGYGFPSGHTALATVIAISLYPYLPKKWRYLVPLSVILVGLSRVYLGMHFPLDVVGGFAIGAAIASLMYLPHHKVGRPKWIYRKVRI